MEKQKIRIIKKSDDFSMEYQVGDIFEVDSTWYGGVNVTSRAGIPLSLDKDEYEIYLEDKRESSAAVIVDLTVLITPKMVKDAQGNEKKALVGHLGTHFDVMDKTFPLGYTRRKAVVYDVSDVSGREIGVQDIDLSVLQEDMFVAFYSGYIDRVPYGSKEYFSDHPQLSNELLEVLTDKKISVIGVDFAGVRRGKEHTPMDQYCADKGVFVVENLCNLKDVLKGKKCVFFTANTYPMNYAEVTGLPCRVTAEF
ncbi:MAG: cyclase family protein [Eubacteriales bacterium]|nr:cyclase family protein [Eubacteriales bacterium]